MNRTQFWILTVIAVLLSGVLWAQFWIVKNNNQLSAQVNRGQQIIAHGQQLGPALDQMAKRVAKASDNDPQFRSLLVKHGLNVTLDVEGKEKKYP
jgi:hypothetical protein